MANQKPYQTLANAIVLQAVQDYRRALSGKRAVSHIPARQTISECEMFFLSEYFTLLTDVDGGFLIQRIRQEAKHDAPQSASKSGGCSKSGCRKEAKHDAPQSASKSGSCSKSGCRKEAECRRRRK